MREEEEEKFEYKETELNREGNKETVRTHTKEINQEVRAELEEQLQELELVRKRYYDKYKVINRIYILTIILFLVGGFTVIPLTVVLNLEFFYMFKWFALFLGFGFVGFILQFVKKGIERKYEHHFKYTVLERVVDLFFSDLRYTPKRAVLEEDFKNSRIDQTFRYPYKKYQGEDYFEGSYRGYPISFSEAATTYTKKTVIRSKGKTVTSYQRVPLFSGLFFMLEMPENRSLGSFWGIVPYLEEGELLDDFEMAKNNLQELILTDKQLDAPEFRYRLQERSIPLNASLLQQLATMSKRIKEPIWVTYENNRLYIGVSTTFKHNKKILEVFENESMMRSAIVAQEMKKDILYLFSPPALKISVLENKDVILKPVEEIQSCLDIIDEVLILFNQVQRLED